MKNKITRRIFLKNSISTLTLLAAVPTIVPENVFGAGKISPNSKVNVGCIGVGPQGRGVMSGFLGLEEARVVALCDVAKINLDAAVNMVKQKYQTNDVATYHDFRELLERKDIDAVLIATPDHWHVPVAIAAAKAGKDMYVEKPLGLSLEEDKILRKIIQKKRLIFQFGTQQRSSREFRQACELVRNGYIGELKQINVWCSASRPGGSTKPTQPPEGLDYEFWLGPAPLTPYTDGKCFDNIPPGTWKTWWFNYDYALGFIAGWGVHPLDIAYWGYPDMMKQQFQVYGKGVFPKEGACNTAVAWEVSFEFPGGVKMKYKGTPNGYNEKNELTDFSDWKNLYGQIADHGTGFNGTKGWIMVRRGEIRTSPESLATQQIGPNEIQLTKSSHHSKNFIDSVKSRKPSICPIEDAVIADTLCHLSDIATRLQRQLTYDPKKEQFIKDKEANKKLELRPMRKPWKI
ncbi:MAG: Gfo/Idh/MocA family protein [Verrucomicrobiia bacterium]